MKATLTALAALLVSTLMFNAASAQSPYPEMPAGYGYPGYGPGEYTANYGGSAQAVAGGCAAGGCGAGGCAKGGCGKGGCSTCGGGAGVWDWLKNAGCGTCAKPAKKCKGDCCSPLCAAFKGWLCKPCPSDAPVLRKAEYPLGFPTHPYARSPRDYFMHDDP